MKSLDDNFADWESHVLGFGYGTGEEPVLGSLKRFLELCCKGDYNHAYDYKELETTLTAPVAWLLINLLAHEDMIEYGTSPRFGWLTQRGETLKAFMNERALESLVDLCNRTYDDDGYIQCMPDHCNCDNGDCRPSNPFWKKRR